MASIRMIVSASFQPPISFVNSPSLSITWTCGKLNARMRRANITPGAAVTLTQTSTHLKRTFTVGEAGQYTFTFLEPGLYTLEVQVRGFKTFRQEQLELAVAQAAELNVTLQPGDIAETVNVTANENSLQLDTASSSLGGVVQRTQIDDLPLNGRNVFQLAQLEVGVSTSPGSRSATPNLSAGGVCRQRQY